MKRHNQVAEMPLKTSAGYSRGMRQLVDNSAEWDMGSEKPSKGTS